MKLPILFASFFMFPLLVGCRSVTTGPNENPRIVKNPERFPWVISKFALSIAQVEGMEALDLNGIRQKVPFGELHQAWESFKALLKPGDEIHQWTNGDGGAPKGYCIIRNGRVAAAFTTIILIE